MSQCLDPVALSRALQNLELRARIGRRGRAVGPAPLAASRLVGRVRRAQGVLARRRDQAHRLEGVRQVRQVLRQALRGGDRAARLPPARLLGVDGLSRQRRLQARLRAHAGGVARVPAVAAAGSGGDGRLRREAARLPAAARARRPPRRSADRARRRRGARGATDLPRALAYLSEVAQRRALIVLFSDLLGSRRATCAISCAACARASTTSSSSTCSTRTS